MGTPEGLLDEVGGFLGPHKRRRVVVPSSDVPPEVLGQSADRVEGASADRFTRQDAEPSLDHIQP